MKAGLLTLVVLLSLLTPASAEDVSAPGKVNRILTSFETPVLAPGESGELRFVLHNPYRSPISTVVLVADIYRFATIEETRFVDGSWEWCEPFVLESPAACSREVSFSLGELGPGNSILLSFEVVTSAGMPHGNPLSESAYFVRFLLTFDLFQDSEQVSYAMASRGHFADDLWEQATGYNATNPCRDPSCRGNINLSALGVDGILPDSSFGVRAPIPIWPFYAIAVGFGISAVLTLFYYAEAHPGRLPRIERRWLRFKVIVRGLFRGRRRRKAS